MRNSIKFITIFMTIILFCFLTVNMKAEDSTLHPITEKIQTVFRGENHINLKGTQGEFYHEDENLPVDSNGRSIYPFGVGCSSENSSCIPEGNASYGGIQDSVTVDDTTVTFESAETCWNTKDSSPRWSGNAMNDGSPTFAVDAAKENYYVRYNNFGTYGEEDIDIKMILVDFDVIDKPPQSEVDCVSAISFYRNRVGATVTGVKWIKVRFEFYKHGTNTPVAIKGNTTFWDIDQNQAVVIPAYLSDTTTNGARGIYFKSTGKKCSESTTAGSTSCSVPKEEYENCDLVDVDNQLYSAIFTGAQIGEAEEKNYFMIYDHDSGILPSTCSNFPNLYNDYYNSSAFAFTEVFEGSNIEAIFAYSNPSYYTAGEYRWNGHGSIELSSETVTNKYNISATVENGTIKIDGQKVGRKEVDEGVTSVVTYQPNDGYVLDKVIVDGVEVSIDNYPNTYTFPNIHDDHTVHVIYKKVYTVTTEVVNGKIYIDGAQISNKVFDAGDTVNVTYEPNNGYGLYEITVNGQRQDKNDYPNRYAINSIDSDYTIRVEYKRQYTITTEVSPTSCATITDSSIVFEHTNYSVDYSVKPDCEGYYLKEVVVDGQSKDIDEYHDSYDFNNITANHTIKVVYMKEAKSPLKTVDKALVKLDETVKFEISQEVDPKQGAYYDNFVIEDNLDEGFIIKSNTVVIINRDGTNVTSSFDINIQGNKLTVAAKQSLLQTDSFYGNKYFIIFEVSIDEDIDLDDYNIRDENNSILIKNIASVTIDNREPVPTNEVSVEIKKHIIHTNAINGEIDPDPYMIVAEGEDAIIMYEPYERYKLVSITVDGQPVDIKDNSDMYLFEEVTEDHEIEVVYQRGYTITTEVENGTISPTPTTVVISGEDAVITYSPNSGYEISELIIDGEKVDFKGYETKYTFEDVDRDHTIKVVYIKNVKTGLFEFGLGAILIVALCAFAVYKFITTKKQIREI